MCIMVTQTSINVCSDDTEVSTFLVVTWRSMKICCGDTEVSKSVVMTEMLRHVVVTSRSVYLNM